MTLSLYYSPLPPPFPATSTRRHCSPSRFRPRAVSKDADDFTKYSGYLFELTDAETESLTTYDIGKIALVYRKKPLIVARRLAQTASTLGRWFARRYYDTVTEKSDAMFEVRAAELRKILIQLGPAYVKIAQAVSSRADLIPPEYMDELSLLQDQITPFSSEVAFSTIEQELGLPIDEIFSEISPRPIAAASLGQVYQARLRESGQLVAVKVQRPGVQAAISLDILILRFLAGLLRRAGKLNTDLQAVVDEWASSLFRELDYRREAKNGIKFRQLYGGIQDVLVPVMYEEKTTRKVLTMEWVEGQKLSDAADLHLIEVGVYCSFNQLLEYGFYHADPHPGNLFRTYNGKLAYLDFGMMGVFELEFREGFVGACVHLVNRDFDALAKDFVTLGLLPPTVDKGAVTKALTGVFENALSKGIQNLSFGDLLGDLGITMYKFKFQIPSYFSLVIRSLAVLEGIAIQIKPDYKVLGEGYPWIARKILTDSSLQLRSALQSLLYKDGVFRIDRLESLLSESLRARVVNNQVAQEIDTTDSRVVTREILNFTLTEKGSFIREMLLQEIAKGLDALGVATFDSINSVTTRSLPFGSFSVSLMSDDDIMNLRTLRRLLFLFSGLQKVENPNRASGGNILPKDLKTFEEETSLLLHQVSFVQEIGPIVSVVSELPPESQQQLLRLPADLTGRLISRAVARTLRRIFL